HMDMPVPMHNARPVVVRLLVERPEAAELETDHRADNIGVVIARHIVTPAHGIVAALVEIARADPAAIAGPADFAPAARAAVDDYPGINGNRGDSGIAGAGPGAQVHIARGEGVRGGLCHATGEQ